MLPLAPGKPGTGVSSAVIVLECSGWGRWLGVWGKERRTCPLCQADPDDSERSPQLFKKGPVGGDEGPVAEKAQPREGEGSLRALGPCLTQSARPLSLPLGALPLPPVPGQVR